MVATYLLALVTGRQFGINMTYPCDVKYFLVPNKINWYIKISDIEGLSTRYIDGMGVRARNINLSRDFNEMYPEDVVFLRTNDDLLGHISRSKIYSSRVPDEYKGNRFKVFGKIWNDLMKYSLHFHEHFDSISYKIPKTGKLVCAHVRMRSNPTIPNDAKAINHMNNISKLWTFLSKYEKNASKIFIATDSLDVRKSARKWFKDKELDAGGLIMHVDSQGKMDKACLGLEMALLDQMMLTRCDVLVCSKSNFGRRAAFMSQLKQDVFYFDDGKITAAH